MKKNDGMNILLCIDDFKGDYARHCAVTILSVLETNKNHKIKFYIMSSCLPEENIEELKRIVKKYNQEIEFIIRDNIIPEDIKSSLINRRNLTRGTWYRLFFPLYIRNIDRLLYLDCDVLVNKDISSLYNMNMEGKAIVGYFDQDITLFEKINFLGTKNYINAGVLLIDVKKFKKTNITSDTIIKINNNYDKRIKDADQDYINIIFKNDILIGKKGMNYIIGRPFFNPGINNAYIYHCLGKPYIECTMCPKKIENLYYFYLDKTKWKGFSPQKRRLKWIGYLHDILREMIVFLCGKLFGLKGIYYTNSLHKKFIKIFNHE